VFVPNPVPSFFFQYDPEAQGDDGVRLDFSLLGIESDGFDYAIVALPIGELPFQATFPAYDSTSGPVVSFSADAKLGSGAWDEGEDLWVKVKPKDADPLIWPDPVRYFSRPEFSLSHTG